MANKKKIDENEALVTLIAAAEALGWNVAIPSLEDDEEVMGLIMGKEGYIDWVTDKLGDDPIPDHLRRKLPKVDDDEPMN